MARIISSRSSRQVSCVTWRVSPMAGGHVYLGQSWRVQHEVLGVVGVGVGVGSFTELNWDLYPEKLRTCGKDEWI